MAVTDDILNILDLIPSLGKPSPMDLKETKMTLEALCREMNGRDLSDADQEHLSNILHQASETHLALENKGMVLLIIIQVFGLHGCALSLDRRTWERYYVAIKDSIKHQFPRLKDEFAEALRQRGY
jgi:hypothetical protein